MSQENFKSWSGKTILLVDDDELCGILLFEIFNPYKINFVYIADGYKAVEYCQKNKNIDLVLMDIKLHNIDGFQVTKLIKNLNPQLPVIFFTAYLLSEIKEKCFESGCDEIISKPFNMDELFSKIDYFFK
jgi:CheY-like chemotaxis protein